MEKAIATNKTRKHRGYKSQDIVAKHLQKNGFPWAESTGAGRTGSDVTGVVGIDIEVKARRGLVIAEAMRQLHKRRLEGKIGAAVLRLDGQGPAAIEEWPVLLSFQTWIELIRDAGYGDPR